ncbi:hypothetical protein HPG69_009928 [Diceros bicornis minor]|uniref:Uncharacterized protein n=1 Tax=Diceros bicornis minor TaxID=77932 RepID=A0A7J7E856_DICBM|nr:hypothetical protein HPG69_009928 [Diceros bicornis minor]
MRWWVVMGAGGEAAGRCHDTVGVLLGPARLGPLGDARRAARSSVMRRGPQGGQGARPGCGSDTSRCRALIRIWLRGRGRNRTQAGLLRLGWRSRHRGPTPWPCSAPASGGLLGTRKVCAPPGRGLSPGLWAPGSPGSMPRPRPVAVSDEGPLLPRRPSKVSAPRPPPPPPGVGPGRAAAWGPEPEPPGPEGADSRRPPATAGAAAQCGIPGGEPGVSLTPLVWGGAVKGEGSPHVGDQLPPLCTLSQEPGSPVSAEVPYCDLPRRPPASEDLLSASTVGCQSVVGPGLGPGPERWVEPRGLGRGFRVEDALTQPTPHPFTMAASVRWLLSWVMWSVHTAWARAGGGHLPRAFAQLRSRVWRAMHLPCSGHGPQPAHLSWFLSQCPAGLPAGGPTAAPKSGSREPGAVPYLGGLASSLCGSFDEGPDSGTSSSPDCGAPDDTSNPSSTDWDPVERREEAPSRDELTVMIPRKPQEGPRADNARRVPLVLTRSPVGGDAAGQRKEDTGGGSRSAGQHWAKLRGESRYFSVERHQSALNQATSATPQSGPRSATSQASSLHCSAQKDVAQAASTPPDTPRASSPPRITQRDNPRTSSTQRDTPRSSSTQRNTARASSPSRVTQRDNPRTSSTQRNDPRVSSPPRATEQDNSRISSTQQDKPQTSFPTWHRDAPSFSSPPRQAPEPSLFFQDPPGTSMESLAPSADSLHGSPVLPPQVCIGHRDAPRASSPPRHPPSDLALLTPSPRPGSSGGSWGSAPPGETRHNLEREEYTVLADLPPPRRLAQRDPGPQCSNGGRTRSPGRAEVERLFGQEHSKFDLFTIQVTTFVVSSSSSTAPTLEADRGARVPAETRAEMRLTSLLVAQSGLGTWLSFSGFWLRSATRGSAPFVNADEVRLSNLVETDIQWGGWIFCFDLLHTGAERCVPRFCLACVPFHQDVMLTINNRGYQLSGRTANWNGGLFTAQRSKDDLSLVHVATAPEV